jgi:hypothetical protein
MSSTHYVFIARSRVPDRTALQASIDAIGFDLKLHPGYTRFEDSGFLPFVLNGRAGFGFEIYYQDASAVIGDDKNLQMISDGRDYCISMVWSSSMGDLACGMIVSCALTKDFGALVSYEGNPPEPLEAMLACARDVIAEGKGEEPPTASPGPASPGTAPRKPWWKLW